MVNLFLSGKPYLFLLKIQRSMTSRNEAKLSMYNAVLNFCDENSATIATLTAFPTVLTAFANKVEAIEDMGQLEAQVISGVTINKADLKKTLSQTASTNAAALFAFATAENDVVLKEKARYSYSDIFRLKDEELTLVVQNIIDQVNANVASLAGYGITAATVADFQDLIDDYNSNAPTPRNAISLRKSYKVQLQTLFKEADSILKDQMDKLALQLKTANPGFYIAYTNNRVIIDAGSSPTQVQGIIVDQLSGDPLSGVIVQVVDQEFGAVSNAEGGYTIQGITNGTYSITFTKTGYVTKTVDNIIVLLGQTTDLNTTLEQPV